MGIGTGLSRQPHVDLTVEQHQDLDGREPSRAGFETKMPTGRGPAHVADLEVEDDHVGLDLGDGRCDLDAGVNPTHGGTRTGQGRRHLVVDPVGVGGEQHVGHRCAG